MTFAEEKGLDIYDKVDAQRIKTCNGWTTGDSITDMSKAMVISTSFSKRLIDMIFYENSLSVAYR